MLFEQSCLQCPSPSAIRDQERGVLQVTLAEEVVTGPPCRNLGCKSSKCTANVHQRSGAWPPGEGRAALGCPHQGFGDGFECHRHSLLVGELKKSSLLPVLQHPLLPKQAWEHSPVSQGQQKVNLRTKSKPSNPAGTRRVDLQLSSSQTFFT